MEILGILTPTHRRELSTFLTFVWDANRWELSFMDYPKQKGQNSIKKRLVKNANHTETHKGNGIKHITYLSKQKNRVSIDPLKV